MTDTQRLKDKLTDLRLKGMLQQLDPTLEQATQRNLSVIATLHLLTDLELGIVKLTQKIARLCSKERTIEGFGLSRAPVFSLFPAPQLSSRGRRLRAIFH